MLSHHASTPSIQLPRRRGRRGEAGDERGAVIIELAIVSVFMLSLFAGTYDFGQAWRTGLAANEAARTGARVASARGPLRDADYSALSGVKSALESAGKLDDLERIVIFEVPRTGTADDYVPCKTAGGTNCQVITGAAFRTNWVGSGNNAAMLAATETNGCLVIATSKGWCPTGRDNDQTSESSYGIWIKLRHDYEFPLLGDGTDVSRRAVMRLEPKVS